jgi:hypothetical protein
MVPNVCRDYEYSVWLVPLLGGGALLLSGVKFVQALDYGVVSMCVSFICKLF